MAHWATSGLASSTAPTFMHIWSGNLLQTHDMNVPPPTLKVRF